jgi:hypothetical protein
VKKLLAALLAISVGLVCPSWAHAARPTLLTATATSGHIAATWTPGGEIQVIEAATQTTVGSDGSFFREFVKVFDVPIDGQTNYVDPARTDPGTYFVHIGQWDDGCICRLYSNILTVTIANVPPTISALKATIKGAYAKYVTGSVQLCDPEGGAGTLTYRFRRFHRGRVAAGVKLTESSYTGTSCGAESFFLSVPSKLFKKGDLLRMDVQAKDSYGANSAILTRKWTLR